MKKPPATATTSTRTVTVLSVSPLAEDHASLQAIFDHSKWELFRASSLTVANDTMNRREIGVVICERDLEPGSWADVLQERQRRPNAPSLIVASRLADEHLWAEALTAGAFDVLAKPFDRLEVVRSVSSAWLDWYHKHEAPARGFPAMRAAS